MWQVARRSKHPMGDFAYEAMQSDHIMLIQFHLSDTRI